MFRRVVLLAFCVCAGAAWCDDAPASYGIDQCRLAERAWFDGRWLDARNAWTRALAWDALSSDLSAAERADAERRWSDANARWQATRPPPAPSPEAAAAVPARPRSHGSRRRKPARDDDGATAAEIMARARTARDAGQLESALRLYRLAAKRPGGKDAARAAAEVAAEMGDQVER